MTSWPSIRDIRDPKKLIEELVKIPIVRYLVMAVVCVCFELGTFVFVNSVLGITYIVATPVSMAVGITLNWVWSRKFVFQTGRHKTHVEFTLVMIASLIGAGMQLVVVSIFVEHLRLLPIVGKLVAIMITFFWNFWFRKKYVFHSRGSDINPENT